MAHINNWLIASVLFVCIVIITVIVLAVTSQSERILINGDYCFKKDIGTKNIGDQCDLNCVCKSGICGRKTNKDFSMNVCL